ncbi:unnamed protein product [Linum trigynum]|uniref:Uncharacterized protein n=1 Tax=Linum trigynum TaxID=586398 RepID=A0AAV2FXC9_9ROSI
MTSSPNDKAAVVRPPWSIEILILAAPTTPPPSTSSWTPAPTSGSISTPQLPLVHERPSTAQRQRHVDEEEAFAVDE